MTWQVPLTEVDLLPGEVEAGLDVLRSEWLTMGPRTQELEARFADHTGADHAVAVSSGSAALHLACLAAGVGPGDEVIVPAETFVATAHAVRHCGAEPVLCDSSSPLDPNLDPAAAADAITPHTKAVIAVHLCGYPADVERLGALCEEHGISLIEDCAQAAGARLRDGRMAGAAGALGTFSFFSKTQLGVGEGGIVTTGSEELASRMRSLRSHAMTSVTWDRHRGHAETYDVIELGFNYRIDELRAALALARLGRLDAALADLRATVRRYRESLADVDGVEIPFDDDAVELAGHFAFPILLADVKARDAMREQLKDRGIQTTFYPSLSQLSEYRRRGSAPEVPRAEEFADRHCALPLFAAISEEQIELVSSELRVALAA